MKNKATTVSIVVCLILLPFFSWLYLKKGVSFRINALTELNHKVLVCDQIWRQMVNLKKDSCTGKVSIFINSLNIKSEKNLVKLIKSLYEQNNGTHYLKIYLAENSRHMLSLNELDFYFKQSSFLRKISPKDYFALEELALDSIKMKDFNCIILDNKLNLRNTYNFNNFNEIASLVRHSSILLPVYKRKTTTLVRQNGY